MEQSPGSRLVAYLEETEREFSLARGALLLAQEDYPKLDIDRYLGRFEELARPLIDGGILDRPKQEAEQELAVAFFNEMGFRGNHTDYYDPRNSYLNEVLDRKLGIPITLAIVLIELGKVLKLDLQGVSFPGHFLVKSGERFLDPYRGLFLDTEECKELFTYLHPGAPFEERFLLPSSPRQVLARIARNLKQIHLGNREPEKALACCDRILVLLPDSPEELRERAWLNLELERFRSAKRDFELFLDHFPDHTFARGVRDRLAELDQMLASMN
jgi:regulator of sirC expression with transglutaminase-like and TPR domain